MKKLYILFFVGALILSSCSDLLDTLPTDKVPKDEILTDAERAQTVMNGIYRAMYSAEWGESWFDENSGIMAYTLVGDLMGDDHYMDAQGNGWFFFDYALMTADDYDHKSGRPYQTWNFFYKIITNTNEIIDKEGTLKGDEEDVNAVMGQAYAMRAFAYFNLIQFYQQSIVVDKDLPGVPLYTEPTTIKTEGKPRGTIEQTYTLINSDIDKAVALLKSAENGSWAREHTSWIDYYVACGLQARINLAQGTNESYMKAADAAKEALTKPSLRVGVINEFAGWNNKLSPNVLWALEVIASQSEHFRGFFSHMDADADGMYAAYARQCISKWLYDEIPATDERKAWWRGELTDEEIVPGTSWRSYCQLKFKYADPATRTGDYLIMRAEEMLLIAAEAECHLGNYPEARRLITELGSIRDTDYAARLAAFTDDSGYNDISVDPLVTLMDEILFQRRVELWGENCRLFDLKRLGLGITRDYDDSNHSLPWDFEPESIEFLLPIPQAEFDGNPNLDPVRDQNPM